MSEEKSLSQIAYEKFYLTRGTADDIFYEVASAVEKEVLARLNKSEAEPVAGQELTFVQTARWVEQHGSTEGLQWQDGSGKWWSDDDVKAIYAGVVYRVAPKKVNDPDDQTTWEKGVAIFRRDYEDSIWILDTFNHYSDHSMYKYYTSDHGVYKYAKLATPEQIEAWKLINGDL